ncbi:RNA-binding region RNP-1 domain-containing protein [Dictyostelium discoideum AX4]|uniref:RNA-binding region RNP-1 domain-containing protein n=1 Tax=Dictyostelium discoideum TaxID=44689 RepID=Q54EJ3_DICDI|nr:RNA-binding region RNP-1 domain-containing protein [Dictyostelium discoideum AX4]EAL61727.1 RNA-binding region RNP-1 domain-containing protein [Dictyostelium discoideum AX4]|eukprot:XP_635247.1 RNA-binding region RNP-1 domain-containing protein [Dictyostelium discoideum AX4]
MSTKLFVGQIPKSFNEEEIKNLFTNIANIESVSLIKNKTTNEPQGCAFVSVPSREEADRAIEQLHNSKKFQGVLNNLQVKYADSEQEKLASKLFVGMLPRSYEEEQIRELFEPHGVVEDICILRGPNSESKGCGFIKFDNRESALSAIATLNGMKLDGSPNPLVVKFADTEKDKKKKQKQQQIQIQMQQRQQQQQQQQQQPSHQQQQSHQQSFQSQYQQPVVNQFPPKMNQQPFIVNPYFGQMPNFNFIPSIDSSPSLLGTPPIIGDGIYDIYSNSQFDNKYNNNGGMGGNGGNNGNMYGRNFNNGNNGPMGGMNGNGMNNGGPMGNGMNNGGPMGNGMNNGGPMGNGMNNGGPMGNGMNGNGMNGNGMGGPMGNGMNNGMGGMNQGGPMGNKKNQSVGPQGSNLFVYNIPNYFSDNDLLGLFQQYGIVVSAKVYVDKNTGVSKGFGFVSYDNPASANLAISNLHGQMMAGKKLKVSLKQTSGQGSQPY